MQGWWRYFALLDFGHHGRRYPLKNSAVPRGYIPLRRGGFEAALVLNGFWGVDYRKSFALTGSEL